MQDNNLIVLNGQICAKFYYLVSLGISEGTINNGISKNKNGKSFKWDMKKKGIFRYIYVESIPKYTYDKYNLDKPIKRFKDILSKPQRPQTPFLVTRFKIIADSKWNIYDGHYQQFHPNHQLIQSFAKTHAIFQEIIQLSDCKKFTLKELYKNYKKIPLDIPLYYRAKSYTTFVKKIKQARMDGIDNVLPHKLLKVEGNSKKFTTYWKNLTLKLYSDPMKYTKTSIWEKVNHERHLMDLDHLSYQTIQSFLNSDEVINITTKSRHGRRIYRDVLVPYIQLTSESANELWQIDGFRIPFLCLERDNNITYYDAIIITDFYSRKIIGFSIGKNENSSMIINAVENAIRTTSVLPRQIIHDNFSAFFHKDVVKLKERMTYFSVIWNKTNSDSPREKGNIERTIGTLKTRHLREIKGFTGEGVKSKREFALPSPEKLNEYAKKNNCFSLLEIYSIVKKSINNYNKESINGKPSPNSLYEQSLSSNSKKYFSALKEYHIPFLFFSSSKNKINKSMITMYSGGVKYNYTLPSKLRNSLNRQRVKVYFDYENREEIFVFSLKHECSFLAKLSVDLDIPRNIERRTQAEKKYVQSVKSENIKHAKSNSELINRIKNEHNKPLDSSILIEGIDDKSIIKQSILKTILNEDESKELNVIVKNIKDIKL